MLYKLNILSIQLDHQPIFMKTILKASDVLTEINTLKLKGKTIGFVPTMGALHNGHLSLVQKSISENDITVVSIFVNPTQFNNPNDLENYPRTLENDAKMLKNAGCDIIFNPATEEMYPEKDTRIFKFGNLENTMEGAFRPGHFNGVAQVVTKLFHFVPANKAYFGMKDFQQLAIIKNLVKQQNIDIQIVPCPIIREVDGLAMSSRNALLSPEHRKAAVLISQTLLNLPKLTNLSNIEHLKMNVVSTIDANHLLKVEYFDIVDSMSLKSIHSWAVDIEFIACIAVQAGNVRLIDNVIL